MAMKAGYKNICLVGFMGVGKSSVGKLLAEKLSLTFYDTDKMVEKEMGMDVPEIFETRGESFFRKKEEVIVTKILAKEKSVVALGGGAFVNPNTQKKAQNSLVICLSSSFKTFMEKLDEFRDSRPMLKNKTFEEIQELYDIRAACYTNCDFNLDVEGLSPEETADKILAFLKKESG